MKRIAQLGRQEEAFTGLDQIKLAADNRAFALSERFTLQTQLILTRKGNLHPLGDKVLNAGDYQLRGSPDGKTFSVEVANRGKILEVQAGSLKKVTVTPQDIQAFEQYSASIRTEVLQTQRLQASQAEASTAHVR